MILSVTRDRTAVTEIGRKSLSCVGLEVFERGRFLLASTGLVYRGYSDERLVRFAKGLAKNGDPLQPQKP